MNDELRVEVDSGVCIGSAECEFLAPRAFKVGEDGWAIVVDPSSVDAEKLREAERSCPSGAIKVSGGQG